MLWVPRVRCGHLGVPALAAPPPPRAGAGRAVGAWEGSASRPASLQLQSRAWREKKKNQRKKKKKKGGWESLRACTSGGRGIGSWAGRAASRVQPRRTARPGSPGLPAASPGPASCSKAPRALWPTLASRISHPGLVSPISEQLPCSERRRRGHAGSGAGAGALRPAAAVPGRAGSLAAAAPGGEERLQEAEQGERTPQPSSPLPWLQGRGVQRVWGGFVGEQRAVRWVRRALSTPRGFAREQMCFLTLPERPVQCPGSPSRAGGEEGPHEPHRSFLGTAADWRSGSPCV